MSDGHTRRGIRDVATLRTRANPSAPVTRTQAVNRFALLENERARLLRELHAYTTRGATAERKLAAVEEELSGLKLSLLAASPAEGGQARKRPPTERKERPEPVVAQRPNMLLEY